MFKAEWKHYSKAPKFIKDSRPAKPSLGEHRIAVATISSDFIAAYVFNNNDDLPYKYVMIPHPDRSSE